MARFASHKMLCLLSQLTASAALAEAANPTNGPLQKMQRHCLKMLHALPGHTLPKIIITCSSRSSEWRVERQVPASSLQNRTEVLAGLSSLSFSTTKEFVTGYAEPVQCPSYAEWQGEMEGIDLILSCRELLDLKKLDDVCKAAVQEIISADPDRVQWQKTGRTFDPCTENPP